MMCVFQKKSFTENSKQAKEIKRNIATAVLSLPLAALCLLPKSASAEPANQDYRYGHQSISTQTTEPMTMTISEVQPKETTEATGTIATPNMNRVEIGIINNGLRLDIQR